jgi:hypothetical protein
MSFGFSVGDFLTAIDLANRYEPDLLMLQTNLRRSLASESIGTKLSRYTDLSVWYW